ncbi:MAG: PAS domain-containing protein, partial [Anaerolineales bacterium]|nr:PAS domain-containing protein [Anaerolineales bacterium]
MATSLISADKILDAILQAAHQPVFIKDQDGAYVVVNAAAARILGAAVDEIVGRTDLVLFPGELGVRLHHMSRQTVETGSPITFAIQRQLDGAVAAYIVRQYPYESQHNRLGAVGFMEAVEAGSSVTKVLRQSGGTVLSLDEASRAVGYAAAAASAAPPLAVAQSRQRILQLNRALLALQSAATAVASSLNLQHVLDTFTWEMVNLLDTESCFVLEWLPEADKIRLLATYQVEDWEAATAVPPDIPLRSRPTTRNVLVDRHITQLHVSQPYLEAGERAYLNLRGARKLLLLPMVFQDRVLGIVEVLERGEQRVFSDQEVSLAQLLANQAAAAVANARLYEELEQRLQELSSLNQIGQAITSTLDLEKTLTIITNHTLTLLRVEAAAVALLDEERGDAWYAAVSGAAAERMRGRRLPLD